MTIRVSCPGCGKSILAPDKAAGRSARCPVCNCPVTIPAIDANSTDAANGSGDIDFDIPETFSPGAAAGQTGAPFRPVPQTTDRQPATPQAAPRPADPPPERIRVSCPNCSKSLAAPAKLIGKSVKCPNCQNAIKVERPDTNGPSIAGRSREANDLFQEFDVPPQQQAGGDATTYDPNDPFAYLDQFGSDGLEAIAPNAMPPVVQGVKRKKKPKSERESNGERTALDAVGDWTRIFLYTYMGLAMVPLAVSLFLPEIALGGPHLPEDSKFHWVYAGISIVGFLTLLLISIRSPDAGPIMLVLVGLFTGTIGIVVLLLLQLLAAFSSGLVIRGRSIVVLFFLIVKFIGLMYYFALSEESSFWASVYGFTLGVGLCEELCKILPVIWYLQNNRDATWKGACLVGLASGIGFGVSEGIHYAGGLYNGYASWEIYVVRFVSCVALHAAWTATIACTMYRRSDLGGGELGDLLLAIVIWIGVPVLLHGMYDTWLKHEQNGWALVTAVLTIAWMAYAVERCARSSRVEQPA